MEGKLLALSSPPAPPPEEGTTPADPAAANGIVGRVIGAYRRIKMPKIPGFAAAGALRPRGTSLDRVEDSSTEFAEAPIGEISLATSGVKMETFSFFKKSPKSDVRL